MGAGGVPSKGVEVTTARNLPCLFKPNSRYDRLDKNGKRVQSRWYDKEGKAIRNRDYNERGKIPSPHDHIWTWKGEEGKRGRGTPAT